MRVSRTTAFRSIAGIAVLLACYAIAGFVVAPKLVRSALLEDIPKAIGATPTVGEIHINPFLFQVSVEHFALAGADGEKLLGFERLFIDFELSSIWHRAYSFAHIDIDSPYVGAVMAQNGSLNLAQLLPKAASPPNARSEPLPAVRIGSLKVSRGLVTYEDRSRPEVFAARLEPINIELRDFRTGIQGGQFIFTGASKLGERIEWHGHLSLQPLESDGEFQLQGLLAHTVWEYLQDRVNVDVPSGSLDLAASYRFAVGAAGEQSLQLDVSKATLSDLRLRPKGTDVDWVTVPALAVTDTTVDFSKRQAHVDLVSLTGLTLAAWLEADGTVNLMKLAAAPRTAPIAAAPVSPGIGPTPAGGAAPASALPGATLTTTGGAPAAAAAPWTFDLRQFELRDASVAVEDRTVQPAVKLLLAPLSVQVNGVSQDLTQPVSMAIDARLNGTGTLAVSGTVSPQPALADLDVKLAGIDLTLVQPYIAQHTAMTLLVGTLGAEGKLHYVGARQPAALQFTGNLNVANLHTVDDALHDDFINWERLDVRGVNYTQAPDRLNIEQIVARGLYARVIIEPDATLNVKRVLKIAAAAAAAPGGSASGAMDSANAAMPAAAAPSVASQIPAAQGGRQIVAGKRLRTDATVVPRTAAAAPATQMLPMAIKTIVVQDSQVNFSDLSVAPNFSAGIQKLAGTVTGLSSKPGARAQVDLQGSVDTFSPVSIAGQVNLLGPLYIDLAMNFRNISLPVFDPYSGKFTGYDIAKGKLTTELHYAVDGRKLDAQHHIIIEQLEFGDKTASKDAVSLPVKLAVSLLKDRQGVIDLNIPITGSLDDPQFRLAPLIGKVLLDILEKAVTAPFALLGALFGAGPDIQFIDFQPGQATLDTAALDKVKTVAKALAARPQLKIDVPIAVVPEVDRPALAAARFDAEFRAEQAASMGPLKPTGTNAASSAVPQPLDPPGRLALLTRLYKKSFGAEPAFPDAVTHLPKPDILAAKIDYLDHAIHEHIVIGEDELTTLGQRRAQALQQVLLADSEVAPDRVFIVANDKATTAGGVVRLELSLQ